MSARIAEVSLCDLIHDMTDKTQKTYPDVNFVFQLEREISESSSSLRRGKERISELEQRVSFMEKVNFHADGCCITFWHLISALYILVIEGIVLNEGCHGC